MNRFARSLYSFWFRSWNFRSVIEQQQTLKSVPDEKLADRVDDLRHRLFEGESESNLAGEMFSLVREAARRSLGMEHRENQLVAAWHLLRRQVVELPTGEGKTLAATPALGLRALAGRGVWLATSNDYLARRDALSMQNTFRLLGLSVGYIQSSSTEDERFRAYRCDITYGTIREFGFDFLRDRLNLRRNRHCREEIHLVQRQRFSIIVDEADNILLDDARTPLIISEPHSTALDDILFRWSSTTGRGLQAELDFLQDSFSSKVWLTESGRARIRNEARNEILTRATFPEVYESVARSIEAERTFLRDRDYVVRDGKIVIIDRLTGRLAEGRQWQNGIQQSLEASNQLEITPETNPVAKVTIQGFLQGFENISGMTGTAQEAESEFRRTYGMPIVVVPPYRKSLRRDLPAQVKTTRQEKWLAIISEVQEMKAIGRPVLIGTRDLTASEELSGYLDQARIRHQVLTARQEADEAELISRAGEEGTVTVSTSIAGRGTDIQLGKGVAERGGLHVIAADLFDASRVDRQLAGRGGRQGDPASYQKILSLQDPVLEAAWDADTCQRLTKSAERKGIEGKLFLLRTAQKRIERQHVWSRQALMRQDRERSKRHRELGFDPYLDDVAS